ncbi:MAG: peptide ABC transporter substrate-binding protein [Candidatus Dormibacteraeota bacterium]|nr:peptide ABC transporter substrate-binding protein [Candidatus Dormibacteraeota bacterium]
MTPNDWTRRDVLKFGLFGAAMLGGGAALLEACATSSSTTTGTSPRKGGHLIYGGSDIGNLNPILTADLISGSVALLMFDPLVFFDNNANAVHMLAESEPTVSADEKTWTFTLRKGMKWSDGQPITADDVVYSFELLFAPKYASVNFQDRATAEFVFESVTAKDPYTVVFQLKIVFAPFYVYFCAVPIVPKHVLGRLTNDQFNSGDWNNAPNVVSGPFKFVSWNKGSQLTLGRNENYYRGTTLLDGVIFKTISGDATSSLLSGEVDWTQQIIPADLNRLSSGITVHAAEGYMMFLMPNLDPKKHGIKLFGDKNVRKALMYALDRKAMVAGIFFGKAKVADNPWASASDPASWAYDPNTQSQYPFDKSKAESMLDAAGWTKGSDGIRAKDGVRMDFGVSVKNDVAWWVQLAEAVQEQWRAIGVSMNIKQTDRATWVDESGNTRNFDMLMTGYVWFGFDPDPTVWWAKSATALNALNGGLYWTPEMDALVAEGTSTTDRAKRKVTYSKVGTLYMDDLGWGLPLVATPDLWAFSNRVVLPVEIGGYTQVTNWYWLLNTYVTSGQ